VWRKETLGSAGVAGLTWPPSITPSVVSPACRGAWQVTMADFEEALKKISKSVGVEDIRKHQKWMSEFGAT